jgi:hypothetical protein
LTARTALGQFPEKEWLDGPSFFRLSALPTTNPEYPFSLRTELVGRNTDTFERENSRGVGRQSRSMSGRRSRNLLIKKVPKYSPGTWPGSHDCCNQAIIEVGENHDVVAGADC